MRSGVRRIPSFALAAAVSLAFAPSSGRAGEGRAGEGAGGGGAPGAWLADPGTAVLGMGLLRVAPPTAGKPAAVRIHYKETPGDYAAFDSVQLMVLPGDAFAADGRCFADRALAYATSQGGDSYAADAVVTVSTPTLLVVGYGPYFGPDTGRPLSLARVLTLEVQADAGGATWRWVDEQAGELNVKGWTNRPEVERGRAFGEGDRRQWFEVRPLVIYDKERVKGPGDPETAATTSTRKEAATLAERAKALREQGKADAAKDLDAEAADLLANAEASDDRLPVPAATAERFRRLPFRWK